MQTMTSPQLDLLHEIAFEILFSLSIKIFLNNFFSPLSFHLLSIHIRVFAYIPRSTILRLGWLTVWMARFCWLPFVFPFFFHFVSFLFWSGAVKSWNCWWKTTPMTTTNRPLIRLLISLPRQWKEEPLAMKKKEKKRKFSYKQFVPNINNFMGE